jgi:hypothetical protein
MLKIANCVLLALVTMAMAYEYAVPVVASVLNKENYKEMMYECDHAMREHFIAKKSVELNATETSVANLDSSEVGLIVCHDYDKLRKRLKLLNVSDNMLSSIGLEAIEEQNYQLRKFVEIHEIRY